MHAARLGSRFELTMMFWSGFEAKCMRQVAAIIRHLSNHAFKEYVQSRKQPLEEILRRVVREELLSLRSEKSKKITQKLA